MKNKYFILAVFLLFAGSVFTGCENNRDKTTEDAAESIEQAKQDLERIRRLNMKKNGSNSKMTQNQKLMLTKKILMNSKRSLKRRVKNSKINMKMKC